MECWWIVIQDECLGNECLNEKVKRVNIWRRAVWLEQSVQEGEQQEIQLQGEWSRWGRAFQNVVKTSAFTLCKTGKLIGAFEGDDFSVQWRIGCLGGKDRNRETIRNSQNKLVRGDHGLALAGTEGVCEDEQQMRGGVAAS